MPSVRSRIPRQRTSGRGQPEQAVQRAIVGYLRTVLPHGFIVMSVANKPRSAIAGSIEKSMGAVKGWPDVMVYGRGEDDRLFVGAVECKAPSGRVRPEQQAVLDRLQDCGVRVGVARSIDDVRRLVSDWPVETKEAASSRRGAAA